MTIPHVYELTTLRGAAAAADAATTLLVEIPHGATATRDYDELAQHLVSPLPDGLVDFFHVNTDTGAPELAVAVAERFVARHPHAVVTILRCRIPRTFIDCNRRLDLDAAEYKAGGVAPGLMPWVVDPRDKALLMARYEAYVGAVRAERDAMAADGAMLLLHSYAPRTVGVEVDLDIVKSLHHAYQPEVEATWPLRPELDVIAQVGRGDDAVSHAPPALFAALREAYGALGMEVGLSATYPLHPSTLGWEHVMELPGRAMCLELRRDLFVERFVPFAEADIDPQRVARLAEPLVAALAAWY